MPYIAGKPGNAFRTFTDRFTAEARSLDKLFNGGTLFETATDFKLDLKFSKANLLEGVDPALRIEDPAKFTAEIKENLRSVIQVINAQSRGPRQTASGRHFLNRKT